MISVLVADDSALVRRLVSGVLNDTPDIRVIGTAADGQQTIDKVASLQPDLLTLDIEMPVMDGLEALRQLRRSHPNLPVIMFSTLTEKGATVTLDALALGASDYVTKPTGAANLTQSLAEVGSQLIPRVRALTARARLRANRVERPQPVVAAPVRRRIRPTGPLQLVAIGSSTGGPDALSRVLGALTAPPRVPIVVVQHMPPLFTGMLAQRLDRIGPAAVVEAKDKQPLQPGVVYIAPGGHHLEVARRGTQLIAHVHDREPVNFSRPSVDVLFRSVASAFPGSALAIVLTGMGHDGREGSREIGATGSTVVAQDEPSSVVWGMPGAVTEAGLADEVLPLESIGRFLTAELERVGSGALAVGGRRP